MLLILTNNLKRFFSTQLSSGQPADKQLFNYIIALKGEIFRQQKNRRTMRVQLADQFYFLKIHRGISLKELFKNLLHFRLPIVSAKNEWLAIHKLNTLGIKTPEIVGFGERGTNPLTLQSFLLTKALPPHISLEDLCKDWRMHPPTFRVKQNLLYKVAQIAQKMHANHINHRDFYLCHFLLTDANDLVVIDLHRAGIHKKIRTRWIVKDLAGLYFSSKDIGLTQRDLLRFIKLYRGQALRHIFENEATFWQRAKKIGEKLIKKDKHG